MELKELVRERFGEPQKCYGHCEQPSTLKFLAGQDALVAAYSCPGAYVSRIMVYGRSPDLEAALATVRGLVGPAQDVGAEDIRVASRYARDLGLDQRGTEMVMSVAFWTQNYRRTKKDDPDRPAAFLCERCGSVYTQPASSARTLCPACSGA
ncbi:MAG: hypothetical protein ABSF83_02680 [Nitrososphaerales archaeon]|jgi:hypothetical protein